MLPLASARPRGETILVVDDEDEFRTLVVRQLKSAGFDTVEARDGSEAIYAFAEQNRQFSAVLLDLVMPNTCGSEALAMLRYYAPTLPVVITSGYSAAEARGLMERERSVGFLAKPFTSVELATELRRVIADRPPAARHSHPPAPPRVQLRTVRVLLVEDNADDRELARMMLRKSSEVVFEIDAVARLSDAVEKLSSSRFDAVLVDLSLPDSRNIDTLRELRDKAPDVALIALTGSDNMQTELAALAMGAQDYLIKGKDDERILLRAIRHAIERKRLENEQAILTGQLKKALAEIRTLSGLLPVCCKCKRVRDDTGYWEQIDVYIRDHTDAKISHGVCPNCAPAMFPDASSTRMNM